MGNPRGPLGSLRFPDKHHYFCFYILYTSRFIKLVKGTYELTLLKGNIYAIAKD